jgi:hypothetical protein
MHHYAPLNPSLQTPSARVMKCQIAELLLSWMTDQEPQVLPGHEAVPWAQRFQIQLRIRIQI